MEKRKNDYRQHVLMDLLAKVFNTIITPIFYVAVIGAVVLLSFLVMSLVMGLLFGTS